MCQCACVQYHSSGLQWLCRVLDWYLTLGVEIPPVQCSAGGVHNILKLYMLHFEQSVLHCTDKLQCIH